MPVTYSGWAKTGWRPRTVQPRRPTRATETTHGSPIWHLVCPIDGACMDRHVHAVTVDEYLEAAPEPHRTMLMKLRAMLLSILSDGEEGLSYGVPAIRLGGTTVAGNAHAKKHRSYFPHSGSVFDQVDPELLKGYDWAKATLRFPVDQPPNEELIRQLVDIRVGVIGR